MITSGAHARSFFRHLRSTLPLLGLFVLLAAHSSNADTLEDVLNSEQMHKLKSGRNYEALYGPQWFEKGTSFARLFQEKDGGRLLLRWAASITDGFSQGKMQFWKKSEYVVAKQEFTSPGEEKLTVTIMVPHPKYLDMVSMNLITDFSDLEPPRLHVDYKEKLTVKGRDAMLYHHSDGMCSVVLKLSRGGILQLLAKNTGAQEHLVNLAGTLDIDRLNRKLKS